MPPLMIVIVNRFSALFHASAEPRLFSTVLNASADVLLALQLHMRVDVTCIVSRKVNKTLSSV